MDIWIHNYHTVTWKSIRNNMGHQFKLIVIKNKWIRIHRLRLLQKILPLMYVVNANRINAKHKIDK